MSLSPTVSVPLNNDNSHEDDSCKSSIRHWPIFGRKFPKSEVVFFTQVILIYIVVIVSLINISLGSYDKLWSHLLIGCLGYLLPNPNIKSPKPYNINNNN